MAIVWDQRRPVVPPMGGLPPGVPWHPESAMGGGVPFNMLTLNPTYGWDVGLSPLYQGITTATPATADNDPVGRINELVTTNNFLQATGINQGILKIIGGLPYIRFDAIDDLMDASNGDLAQPNTIVIVAKEPSGATSRTLFGSTTAGKQNDLYLNGSDVFSSYAGTTKNGSGSQAGATHVFCTLFNGVSSKLYVDAVQNGTTGAAGAQVLSAARLNANCLTAEFGGMDFVAAWVWAGVDKTASLAQIQTYYQGRGYV